MAEGKLEPGTLLYPILWEKCLIIEWLSTGNYQEDLLLSAMIFETALNYLKNFPWKEGLPQRPLTQLYRIYLGFQI